MKRFNGVLGGQSSHQQGQLPVGCCLDGSPIKPLHKCRGMHAASAQFHKELGIFHGLLLVLSYSDNGTTVANRSNIE